VFHAYESSEDGDGMDVLRALFDQPGLHSYPFVEVPLNDHLFHIDVCASRRPKQVAALYF
jgi:hypothetical protein